MWAIIARPPTPPEARHGFNYRPGFPTHRRKTATKIKKKVSAAISGNGDGAAGGEGTSKGRGKGKRKGKGKGRGKAAGVPRQGGSEAARRVDALEAGDYEEEEEEEEEDLAERLTQSLLEDASGGY